MRSLRLRIAVSVILTAICLIGALAALLYAEVSSRIRDDFDRRLLEDARVVAGFAEFEPGEGLELDFGPVLESFARQQGAQTWWRLWGPDRAVLAGDAEAASAEFPDDPVPRFSDDSVQGVRVRVVSLRFRPSVDDEQEDGAEPPVLGLMLCRATTEVDALLADLGTLFWLVGTATCVLVGGVAAWQVSRGLLPVRRLAAELDGLAGPEVAKPLSVADLPVELVPFVVRIDGLLERLHVALEREREFSGHVAHELRTPLTILRTSADLALRKAPTDGSTRRRLQEMVQTIDQMRALVDDLLILARLEGPSADVAAEELELRPLVADACRDVEDAAHQREIEIHNRVPPGILTFADRRMLGVVLQNLLENAATYTEAGGTVRVEVRPGEVVSVWDSGPQLDPELLARVFDRFWRADAARTDATTHAGLGLSLARALCERMGLRLTVQNEERGGLRFAVSTASHASN